MFINIHPVNVLALFPLPAAMVGNGEACSVQQSGFHAANLSAVTCANCSDIVRKI
jgi:hypothetical protein